MVRCNRLVSSSSTAPAATAAARRGTRPESISYCETIVAWLSSLGEINIAAKSVRVMAW